MCLRRDYKYVLILFGRNLGINVEFLETRLQLVASIMHKETYRNIVTYISRLSSYFLIP